VQPSLEATRRGKKDQIGKRRVAGDISFSITYIHQIPQARREGKKKEKKGTIYGRGEGEIKSKKKKRLVIKRSKKKRKKKKKRRKKKKGGKKKKKGKEKGREGIGVRHEALQYPFTWDAEEKEVT